MKSKTVIALAVAGAFAWPLATIAHDSTSTPRAVNETSDMQVERHPVVIERNISVNPGSFEVGTPLNTSETGPAETWSGFDRWAMGDQRIMTVPSSSETISSMESPSISQSSSSSEELALADESSSEYVAVAPADVDYYVIETQPDYYIVETLPSSDESMAAAESEFVPGESYTIAVIPSDSSEL